MLYYLYVCLTAMEIPPLPPKLNQDQSPIHHFGSYARDYLQRMTKEVNEKYEKELSGRRDTPPVLQPHSRHSSSKSSTVSSPSPSDLSTHKRSSSR